MHNMEPLFSLAGQKYIACRDSVSAIMHGPTKTNARCGAEQSTVWLDMGRAVLLLVEALALMDPHIGLYHGCRNVWIVKPAGSSCGRNIRCVDTISDATAACKYLGFNAVVQK